MALNFDTGDESAFARLGRILHVAFLLSPYEASLPAAFVDINDGYLTTLLPVGGSVSVQANTLVRTASGVMSFATDVAWGVIQGMVLLDQPSQARTQQAALVEFIRQMIAQGKTVLANTIGITPTLLPTNVGNAALVTSTKRGDGLVQENTVAETLRLVCTNDAYTGTATAGQETWGLTGQGILGGTWDYDYPTGSGASTTANAISATQDASAQGNLLTNGDFEDWSDDATPELSNWTLEVGTWGTDIQQNNTNPNQGTYCVQWNPGATNTVLYQEFGNGTDGTSVAPAGLSSYAVNLWLRKVSGTISAGVLTVELTDDTGTVLNDAQGVANSFTVTLSSLTTSYVAYNGTFRLNATPPDVIRLRLRISTDLAGAQFVADDICFAPLNAMYTGGPGWVVFSGAIQTVAGSDGWSIANTNNQGGATYLATFQTGFDRLLGMKQLGQLLPSSGTPNINNTLITA